MKRGAVVAQLQNGALRLLADGVALIGAGDAENRLGSVAGANERAVELDALHRMFLHVTLFPSGEEGHSGENSNQSHGDSFHVMSPLTRKRRCSDTRNCCRNG